MNEEQNPHNPKVTIKTQNFFEAVRINWSIIMFIVAICFAMITAYTNLKEVQAQTTTNTSDIKSLDQRLSDTEGDIKAIREGIDYLKLRAQ
ncbi:MAG: hypothetical protein V4478_03345 [Patescibacteria group bacterium]